MARDPTKIRVWLPGVGTKRVAVLMAPRLGDSLLMMTIAQNLRLKGHEVDIFGDYIHSLAAWFPGFQTAPALTAESAGEILSAYDLCLQMHPDWPFDIHAYHPQALVVDEQLKVTGRDFVKLAQFAAFSKFYLGVDAPSSGNGMQAPQPYKWRNHSQRVVIHPTSTGIQRCWEPNNFLKLGKMLKARGFEPNFIVAPHELADWDWLPKHGMGLPQFDSLALLAAFIYESGWFIGNESGIGHLSSSLGVPTLTLTGRPTRTKCWLPAWAPSAFVYPWWIIGGRLRDKYWRTALSPRAVLRAFNNLRKESQAHLTPPPY